MGLALPAAHAMHALLLDEPASGLNVPAGHGSKVCRMLAAPVAAQKPPVGHEAHVVARSPSLRVPAGHAMQPLLDRANSGLYDPGAHGRQLAMPVPSTGGGGRCVPSGHGMG